MAQTQEIFFLLYQLKENGKQWHKAPKSKTRVSRYMAYRCWSAHFVKLCFLLSERTRQFCLYC